MVFAMAKTNNHCQAGKRGTEGGCFPDEHDDKEHKKKTIIRKTERTTSMSKKA